MKKFIIFSDYIYYDHVLGRFPNNLYFHKDNKRTHFKKHILQVKQKNYYLFFQLLKDII